MVSFLAKKAGLAGVDAAKLLEICVQFPTQLLRQLLGGLSRGITQENLTSLSSKLTAAKVPDGAGEGGILAVYNEVLESPGGIQAAFVAALLLPEAMLSAEWQKKYLLEDNMAPRARVGPNPLGESGMRSSHGRHEEVVEDRSKDAIVDRIHVSGRKSRQPTDATNKHASSPYEAVAAHDTHVPDNASTKEIIATRPSNGVAPREPPPSNATVASHRLRNEAPTPSHDARDLFSRITGDCGGEGKITKQQFQHFLRHGEGKNILGITDADDMTETLIADLVDEAFNGREHLDRAAFTSCLLLRDSITPTDPSEHRSFEHQSLSDRHLPASGPAENWDSHDTRAATALHAQLHNVEIPCATAQPASTPCNMLTHSAQRSQSLEQKGECVGMIDSLQAPATLRGKVTHKQETRKKEKDGKDKRFLVMESAPGINDVYVPRNIFIGWDLEQWDQVRSHVLVLPCRHPV